MAEYNNTFLPTSSVWDVSQLKDMDVTSPEFKELMIRLYQNLNQMSLAINDRATGLHTTEETISGNSYYPSSTDTSSTTGMPQLRQAFHKTVECGTLPNSASIQIEHGIDVHEGYSWNRIIGAATDPINLYGTPMPSVDINVEVDDTYITITTTADYSGYTISRVYLEYLKS